MPEWLMFLAVSILSVAIPIVTLLILLVSEGDDE